MPKIDILKCYKNIVCISISKNIYYIDLDDKFDPKVYDNSLKRITTYMPDHWILEISKGEITLSSIYCAMKAYQSGYEEGLKNSEFNSSKIFADRLVKLLDEHNFIKACWIELYPYTHVKASISKLVSDLDLASKNLNETNMVISRFEKRAIKHEDHEMLKNIEYTRAQLDIDFINVDMCSLLETLFVSSDPNDTISSDMNKIVSKRKSC